VRQAQAAVNVRQQAGEPVAAGEHAGGSGAGSEQVQAGRQAAGRCSAVQQCRAGRTAAGIAGGRGRVVG